MKIQSKNQNIKRNLNKEKNIKILEKKVLIQFQKKNLNLILAKTQINNKIMKTFCIKINNQ
jgi:hypothetical protein